MLIDRETFGVHPRHKANDTAGRGIVHGRLNAHHPAIRPHPKITRSNVIHIGILGRGQVQRKLHRLGQIGLVIGEVWRIGAKGMVAHRERKIRRT